MWLLVTQAWTYIQRPENVFIFQLDRELGGRTGNVKRTQYLIGLSRRVASDERVIKHVVYKSILEMMFHICRSNSTKKVSATTGPSSDPIATPYIPP